MSRVRTEFSFEGEWVICENKFVVLAQILQNKQTNKQLLQFVTNFLYYVSLSAYDCPTAISPWYHPEKYILF